MVEEAEGPASCTRAATILEPTSGNTGISLAMVAKLHGYRLTASCRRTPRSSGASCSRCTGRRSSTHRRAGGSNEAVRAAKQLAAEHPDWVMLYQYGNPANARAHYETTGPELLRRPADDHAFRGRPGHHRDADGRPAATCARGAPGVQIIAAEPRYGELVYGLRNIDEGFVPELYDESGAEPRASRSRRHDAVRRTRDCSSSRGHLRRDLGRLRLHAALAMGAKAAPRQASGPTSRSSWRTAAGSTCRPAPTVARWAKPRRSSKASSGRERGLSAA